MTEFPTDQVPPPGAGGDPKAMVNVPAICLMITAGLGILGQFCSIGNTLIRGAANAANPNVPAWVNTMSGTVGVVFSVIGIAMGIVILMGAMKMRNLQSYNFALAATIIAMIPCVSPCCILGLPFGIWALVVLMKPDVKAAFGP